VIGKLGEIGGNWGIREEIWGRNWGSGDKKIGGFG
jgi:hypothetical protein